MVRLHLHRRPGVAVGEGEDPCPDEQEFSAEPLQNPRDVLIRLNQIMRGWVNYFKHAVCKHILSSLAHFVWWRVARWLRTLHRWSWSDLRRAFTTPDGRWKPITADGIALFNPATVAVTRYRYRGNTIPNPWTLPGQP